MATAMTSPSSMASDLKDLTEQITRLTLLVGGQPHQQSNPLLPANAPRVTSPRPPWNPRCIYCDSLEHRRNQCPEFQDEVSKGVVGLNEQGRVKLMATAEEVWTMFGKGGMKVIVQACLAMRAPNGSSQVTLNAANARVASVGAITFEDGAEYGKLGSSMMTMVQDADGQWVDVSVEEKRKYGGTNQGRRVKPRTDSGSQGTDRSRTAFQDPSHPTPVPNFRYPPPVQVMEVPDEDIPDRTPEAPLQAAAVNKPKFRLASGLNQTITTEEIGEKVMQAPIQLRMCELLAVSTEVANYIHDQTRRRRIPLDLNTTAVQHDQSAGDVSTSITGASVNAVQSPSGINKPLYACPSARTKVFAELGRALDVFFSNAQIWFDHKVALRAGSSRKDMARC